MRGIFVCQDLLTQQMREVHEEHARIMQNEQRVDQARIGAVQAGSSRIAPIIRAQPPTPERHIVSSPTNVPTHPGTDTSSHSAGAAPHHNLLLPTAAPPAALPLSTPHSAARRLSTTVFSRR